MSKEAANDVNCSFAITRRLNGRFRVQDFATAQAYAKRLRRQDNRLEILRVTLNICRVLFTLCFFYTMFPINYFVRFFFRQGRNRDLARLQVTQACVNAIATARAIRGTCLGTRIRTLRNDEDLRFGD